MCYRDEWVNIIKGSVPSHRFFALNVQQEFNIATKQLSYKRTMHTSGVIIREQLRKISLKETKTQTTGFTISKLLCEIPLKETQIQKEMPMCVFRIFQGIRINICFYNRSYLRPRFLHDPGTAFKSKPHDKEYSIQFDWAWHQLC